MPFQSDSYLAVSTDDASGVPCVGHEEISAPEQRDDGRAPRVVARLLVELRTAAAKIVASVALATKVHPARVDDQGTIQP